MLADSMADSQPRPLFVTLVLLYLLVSLINTDFLFVLPHR